MLAGSVGWSGPRVVSPASGSSRPRVRSAAASAGLNTITGSRVVGRITPLWLTRVPISEFVKVDFPAPVGPPMTTTRGASRCSTRGRV